MRLNNWSVNSHTYCLEWYRSFWKDLLYRELTLGEEYVSLNSFINVKPALTDGQLWFTFLARTTDGARSRVVSTLAPNQFEYSLSVFSSLTTLGLKSSSRQLYKEGYLI